MKKNYTIELLYKNLFSRKGSLFGYRFLVIIVFLLSSKFFSQEIVVSGLENIHISENTVIVVKSSDNTSVIIKSDSLGTIVQSKNSEKKDNSKNSAKKVVSKKIAKVTKKKTYENLKQNIVNVFNLNIIPNIHFCCACNSFKSNVSNSQYTAKNFDTENSFSIFLFVYKEKQKTLYNLLQSNNVRNIFFTRPPPISLS